MTTNVTITRPDPSLITSSPDLESRGLLFRTGDVFPLDPFRHLTMAADSSPSQARPWGLRFLRVPMPRAGKHEGPTSHTSGGDGTGPEETTSD